MAQAKVLRTRPIGAVATLARPDIDQRISLESAASEVFTDFSRTQPVVIEAEVSVADAESLMRKAHVKLVLVVAHDDEFLGMLAFRDLNGERTRHMIGQGTARADIEVRDVMVHRDEIRAVAYDEIEHARIRDVVATLTKEHCQHFLVTSDNKIRGIFSASDIARRLHLPVDITEAPSFADICHVVYEHSPS